MDQLLEILQGKVLLTQINNKLRMKNLISIIALTILWLSSFAQVDTCLFTMNYTQSNCLGAEPSEVILTLKDEMGVSKDQLVVQYQDGQPIPANSANGIIVWDGTLTPGGYSIGNLEGVSGNCVLTTQITEKCSGGGITMGPSQSIPINVKSPAVLNCDEALACFLADTDSYIKIDTLTNSQGLDSIVIDLGGNVYVHNDTHAYYNEWFSGDTLYTQHGDNIFWETYILDSTIISIDPDTIRYFNTWVNSNGDSWEEFVDLKCEPSTQGGEYTYYWNTTYDSTCVEIGGVVTCIPDKQKCNEVVQDTINNLELHYEYTIIGSDTIHALTTIDTIDICTYTCQGASEEDVNHLFTATMTKAGSSGVFIFEFSAQTSAGAPVDLVGECLKADVSNVRGFSETIFSCDGGATWTSNGVTNGNSVTGFFNGLIWNKSNWAYSHSGAGASITDQTLVYNNPNSLNNGENSAELIWDWSLGSDLCGCADPVCVSESTITQVIMNDFRWLAWDNAFICSSQGVDPCTPANATDYKDRFDPTSNYGVVGSWIESTGTNGWDAIFIPPACAGSGYAIGVPTYGTGTVITEITTFGGSTFSGLSTPKGDILGHMPSDMQSIDDAGVLCADLGFLVGSNNNTPNENTIAGSTNCFQANYNYRTALWCLPVGCGNSHDEMPEYVTFEDGGNKFVLHLGDWTVKGF